jgi:hypothetical protein
MSGVLEKTVSVILAACALAFVGLLARREFGTPNVSQFGDDSKPPEFVQDWEGLKSRALPLWTANSNLVVVDLRIWNALRVNGFMADFEKQPSRRASMSIFV